MSQSPACARCAHVPKFRACRHQARSRKGRHLPCPMSGDDHKAGWGHGSSRECWVKTRTIDSADTGSCWACSTPTGRRGARRSCVSIRPAAVPADTVIEPDQVPQNEAHRSKAHPHHVQQGGQPCELHDKARALYLPVNTRRESRRPSTLQVFPSMASTPMRWAVSRLREQQVERLQSNWIRVQWHWRLAANMCSCTGIVGCWYGRGVTCVCTGGAQPPPKDSIPCRWHRLVWHKICSEKRDEWACVRTWSKSVGAL